MSKIISELTDMTYLDWTRTRHSSGTAGSFLKAHENVRGRKFYYKLSDYNVAEGICGHECINEIVVSRLLDVLEIEHLDYTLIHANVLIRDQVQETYLCRSEDFKHKGESKVALDAFYDMEHLPGEAVSDFCLRMGFGDFLYDMFLVDFLILNRDRHGANVEILRNRAQRSLRPAPLFDHGVSLAFSAHSDKELDNVNPYEERAVQSFVGGNSAYDNLLLIPADKMKQVPDMDIKVRTYLFDGLEDIMGRKWVDVIWNFLKVRVGIYEDLRNKRQYSG